MKLKKIIIAGLSLGILSSSLIASAEQAKANEYRNILNSNKFCVEYEDRYLKVSIAEEDKKRVNYRTYKLQGVGGWASLFMGEPKKEISAIFIDGRYYQFNDFRDKKKAIMATRDQIKDPCIDPREGWSTVRGTLSLPTALRPVLDADRFNDNYYTIAKPAYKDSGTETDKKNNTYDYDRYTTEVKNAAGKVIMEKSYIYYYLNGEINKIKLVNKVISNGQEIVEQELNNVKILNNMPEKINVAIPEGTKVYGAGLGDMDDLLEQPPLLEQY